MNTMLKTPTEAPARFAPPAESAELRTILLCTDGTPGAKGAMRAAWLLASETGAAVRLVTVLEPLPTLSPPEIGAPPIDLDTLRREDLERDVLNQMHFLTPATWPLEILTGRRAEQIVETARTSRADLIIIGRNHHGIGDRLLGLELSPTLLRQSAAPVLIAGPLFDHLPQNVIVGVDFSPASVTAARTALRLFPRMSRLTLVHVRPWVRLPRRAREQWQDTYDRDAAANFRTLIGSLGPHEGTKIESVTIEGSPASALADFAEFSRTDLLVVGTRQRGTLSRLLEGSTASKLARIAGISALIVPERAAHRFAEPTLVAAMTTPTLEKSWRAQLTEFTVRNAGRRVSVEVDDPSFGAQSQVCGHVLRGADYDPRSGRVELMLGDGIDGPRHLTHAMMGVTSIQLLKDNRGRDVVLRIGQGAGQCLVFIDE